MIFENIGENDYDRVNKCLKRVIGYLVTESPVIQSISPTYGMIAGGTQITISGQRLNKNFFLGAFFTTAANGLPTVFGFPEPELT